MSSIDDDLLCLICQLPLREPVLTRCGHRFCRQCLEKHLARFAPVYLYFIVTHQCKLRSIHRLKNFDKIYIFLLKRACNESVMTSPRKHNIVER